MENQTIKQKRTPTPRQKKGAKALMDNLLKDKPESVGMVLKSVGYGTGLQIIYQQTSKTTKYFTFVS